MARGDLTGVRPKQATGQAVGWPQAVRSIRVQMALLAASLMVIIALAAALLILNGYRAQNRSVELQLTGTARTVSLAVDGRIREFAGVLKTLALSPRLAAGDLPGFDRLARREVGGPGRWVVLADDQGRPLVDTSLPLGAPLPRTPSPLFQADRREVDDRGLYISDLIPGSPGQRPAVGVVTPAPRPDRPTWRLAVALDPSMLEKTVLKQRLPPHWYATLHDRNGRVIARSRESARWVGRLGRPQVLEQILHTTNGVSEGRSLEGPPVLFAYKRSPLTGWTLVAAMPKPGAEAALVQSLPLTIGLVLGLMLLGLALTWWFGGRIARSIDSLAEAAEALGRGAPTPPVATGLSEIDAVGSVLTDASIRLKQREDELRWLSETLESRVAERTRELETTTERLAQARKLEAIGRLTAGVAHDFNNLLAVMIGNLDLLGKRLTDEKLSRFVDHARTAANRGAELTRQLLAFGRRQRMRPAPLELNELARSVGALLGSALGPAMVVRARTGAEPIWVAADRHQLELAIMNLALNARDAMPAGGEVILETGRATVAELASGPEAPPAGDFGVLGVRDTGVGMPPDVAAQIWEPFFSTKKQGAGSGLGLAQVLGVVQQLGGGATVQTEPGRGTCVQLYLPSAAPAAEPAAAETTAAAPAVTSEGVLQGCKIMLVDDDPDVRKVTADLLRDLGCETEELPNGAEALARLDAGARPDVLITDYAMPGMTGAEVARRSQERRSDLPVLLISGYLDMEALTRTWNGPVLAKPFSKEALAKRLIEALSPRPDTGRLRGQ